ncbi:hypothetical protein [Paenibacillus alba]|uniref:Uncharacterized protein n=1 Tax=Paenibacillus alba TaxID=1197127 RepID=A0ABU6G9E1_9BACL|nr:hypothetical protein [Paenibacillus alba]MEC0230771.1 hypothetical protein [Paenibacillus alba]
MTNPSYNPFEDKTIHMTTDQTQPSPLNERAPFNDVIEHHDIVQGVQAPKRLEQWPKWYQNHRRNSAVLSVLIFAAFIVYHVIQIIGDLLSGK